MPHNAKEDWMKECKLNPGLEYVKTGDGAYEVRAIKDESHEQFDWRKDPEMANEKERFDAKHAIIIERIGKWFDSSMSKIHYLINKI